MHCSSSNVTSERNLSVSYKQKQVARCTCCHVCGALMRMWEFAGKENSRNVVFLSLYLPAYLWEKRDTSKHSCDGNRQRTASSKLKISMIVKAPTGSGEQRLEKGNIRCKVLILERGPEHPKKTCPCFSLYWTAYLAQRKWHVSVIYFSSSTQFEIWNITIKKNYKSSLTTLQVILDL